MAPGMDGKKEKRPTKVIACHLTVTEMVFLELMFLSEQMTARGPIPREQMAYSQTTHKMIPIMPVLVDLEDVLWNGEIQ